MRKLKKKALSEMIGYVLLIVIAISLSIFVYAWLKDYVWKPQESCHDGVNIIIEDYSCDIENNTITLELRNMGTFSAHGFIIRAGNRTEGKAVYPLRAEEETAEFEEDEGKIFFSKSSPMKPDETRAFKFGYSNLGKIEIIDIEPIEITENSILLCENAAISQEIKNCG